MNGYRSELDSVSKLRFGDLTLEEEMRVEREGIAIRLRMILEAKSDGRDQAISFTNSTCTNSRLRGSISRKQAWVQELK